MTFRSSCVKYFCEAKTVFTQSRKEHLVSIRKPYESWHSQFNRTKDKLNNTMFCHLLSINQYSTSVISEHNFDKICLNFLSSFLPEVTSCLFILLYSIGII